MRTYFFEWNDKKKALEEKFLEKLDCYKKKRAIFMLNDIFWDGMKERALNIQEREVRLFSSGKCRRENFWRSYAIFGDILGIFIASDLSIFKINYQILKK